MSILKDIDDKEFELTALTTQAATIMTERPSIEISDPEMEHIDMMAEIRTLAKIENWQLFTNKYGNIRIISKRCGGISIGPDYIFTIVLYCFILVIAILLLKMFLSFVAYKCFLGSATVSLLILSILSCTVLGNPGFPDPKITEEDILRI